VPKVVVGTVSDGARRTVAATAYPLLGAAQDMRGLLTVLGGGAMMEGP
jgi:hypothetical protein